MFFLFTFVQIFGVKCASSARQFHADTWRPLTVPDEDTRVLFPLLFDVSAPICVFEQRFIS